MPSQKQPLDLEKRARELTEREQVLNAREDLVARESALNKRQKVFTDAEAKLDVLNKQIKAKEDIIASRNIDLENITKGATERIESLKVQEATVKKSIAVQEAVFNVLNTKQSGLEALLKQKKTELAEVQKQIKETVAYREEQSRLAEDTIADWNSRLVEFRHEADLIQEEKNKLSADIIRLEQDKGTLTVEVDKEEAKLEAIATMYDDKAENYRASLRKLDREVNEKRNELEGVINATAMREQELLTREKSLRLKEGTVNRRQSELDQKERRLKMNYGIAGIDYEDAI